MQQGLLIADLGASPHPVALYKRPCSIIVVRVLVLQVGIDARRTKRFIHLTLCDAARPCLISYVGEDSQRTAHCIALTA